MSSIAASPYTRATVPVAGHAIDYAEAGTGPPVVVLHGLGGIADFPGLDALADRFRLIAPRLPGIHTGDDQQLTSMRDLAAITREFAAALDLDRFAVIAFAAAAKTGLWLAIDCPEQVETLTLASPVAILPDGARLPLVSSESLRHQADGTSPPGLGLAGFTVKESRFVKNVFGPNRDTDLEARMAELRIPVLVLMGTDDYLVPPETGRLYREIMPTSHYILVPFAGPLIPVQRASAFTSVVGDFLTWQERFIYSHTTDILNP